MIRLVLFVFLALGFKCLAQQTDKFALQFGGSSNDIGQKIIQTFDKGYAIIGSTSSTENGSSDIYLLKLDSAGFQMWDKKIGGIGVDNGFGIVQLKDSSFIVVGNTNRVNTGYDCFLARIKNDSEIIWTKIIGGNNWDFLYDLKILDDSTLISVGKTESFDAIGSDVFVIKFNINGDTIQTKKIGGNSDDEAKSIFITHDKKILIGGNTSSYGNGQNDFYCNLLDTNLNIIFSKTFGGLANEYCEKVLETRDSLHFVFHGSTESFGGGLSDFYTINTDFNGNNIFNYTLGSYDNEVGYGICENINNNFVFAGLTEGPNYHKILIRENTFTNSFIFQTQVSGFSALDASNNFSDAYDLINTSDSGYILVGKNHLTNANETNIYVVKFDKNLQTATDIKLISKNILHHFFYPNPFSDYLQIHNTSINKVKLLIVNSLGQIIISRELNQNEFETINTENMPNGLFNVKLIDSISNNIIYQEKCIKLR